eukprot:2341598-Rhodomonas_salina.1
MGRLSFVTVGCPTSTSLHVTGVQCTLVVGDIPCRRAVKSRAWLQNTSDVKAPVLATASIARLDVSWAWLLAVGTAFGIPVASSL